MRPMSHIFRTDNRHLSSPIGVNHESSLPPVLLSHPRSSNPSPAPMSPSMLAVDHLLSPSAAADASMYLSSAPPAAAAAKPHREIDFYKDPAPRDMMIELSPDSAAPLPHHESSGGEDHEVRPPKKRAETWVQDETRCLIGFRREMDGLFNTSKSNKHLWDQISAKMRGQGYDRSPTMCTDKWRNLLKEFKKAKHQCRGRGLAKMSYYKELDELLKKRNKNKPNKSPGAATSGSASKVDSYLQFSEKGLEDAGIPFGSVEATHGSTVNFERHLDHDGQHLAITAADAIGGNGVPSWNWRDTSTNGRDNHTSFGGRVIIIKWGEYTKKVGIDGTAESIKEAIKSAFGLRTIRAFWLEDEDEVVHSLDRDMPLGTYTLHLDEGVTIKVCICEDVDIMNLRTEDKTFYTEVDFRDFLTRRGWTGLREFSGFRTIDRLEDLHPGVIYQGIRLGD